MKEYLLQHLLSFPSSPPLSSWTLPYISSLPFNKFIKKSLHSSPWPTDAVLSVSPPRACCWLSGLLTKAPLESLKMHTRLAAGEKTYVFSIGLVPVHKLQREILVRRKTEQSPQDENTGLHEDVTCHTSLGGGEVFRAHLFPRCSVS